MRLANLIVWVAVALTAGCSSKSDFSILGHWRAERLAFDSLQLPIGPDVVIGEHEISNTATGTRIALAGIERKDAEVVLELPYGVGLSLHFDGPDRVYAKLPLVGRIYYRRVRDDRAAATIAPRSLLATGSTARPGKPG